MVLPDTPPATCNSKTNRDLVTAHKISLLVLIKEFCVVRHKTQHKRERPNSKPDESIWEHTNQQNRDFCSTMLKLIQVFCMNKMNNVSKEIDIYKCYFLHT